MTSDPAMPPRQPVAIRTAVLARAPQPGQAKTRLIPRLGAAGAAQLQGWLIQRTLDTACAARLGPVALWCAPDAGHPAFTRQGGRAHLFNQPAGDLGARMLAACAAGPALPTLVIGTDCPALTADHLHRAAAGLSAGLDAVFYPAEDGGYVLAGLRQPDARVFAQVDWGTDRVMAQTRQRLKALGWRWQEPDTLWDVDRPADFERLLAWQPALASLMIPGSPAHSLPAPPAPA